MKLQEIEKILVEGNLDLAYESLESYLEKNPNNSEAWYLLGTIYRRQESWGDAINAYNKAKLIDPEGPAAAAIESINNILGFVNTDLMNP
ncbi:MAG: tetratricopeptide repeat protein [Bacteroidales bacterium]